MKDANFSDQKQATSHEVKCVTEIMMEQIELLETANRKDKSWTMNVQNTVQLQWRSLSTTSKLTSMHLTFDYQFIMEA